MPSANKNIDKNLVIIDHTPYTLDEFAGLPLFCLTANDWFTYVTGGDFQTFILKEVQKKQEADWSTRLNLTSTNGGVTTEAPAPLLELAQRSPTPNGNSLTLTVDNEGIIIQDKITVYDVLTTLAQSADRRIAFSSKKYRVKLYQYAYFSEQGFAFVNLNLESL